MLYVPTILPPNGLSLFGAVRSPNKMNLLSAGRASAFSAATIGPLRLQKPLQAVQMHEFVFYSLRK